jgi:hypothetical protein
VIKRAVTRNFYTNRGSHTPVVTSASVRAEGVTAGGLLRASPLHLPLSSPKGKTRFIHIQSDATPCIEMAFENIGGLRPGGISPPGIGGMPKPGIGGIIPGDLPIPDISLPPIPVPGIGIDIIELLILLRLIH